MRGRCDVVPQQSELFEEPMITVCSDLRIKLCVVCIEHMLSPVS
jgi:hypothetical protein